MGDSESPKCALLCTFAFGSGKATLRSMRIGIVGAGFGGLSAAARLASDGHQVDVFEKQLGPGGKAFEERINGYRFDTGPSLLTMRQVFSQLFAECGEDLGDWVQTVPLDPICHYFWDDGTRLHSRPSPGAFALELQNALGEDPAGLYAHLERSREIYDITAELFLWHSLHERSTFGSPVFRRALRRVGRIDAFRTMDKANRAHFRNPKAVQLFNRYATYNGSSPYLTPATLNIIPHVEYGIGAWAIRGGIHALPQAMARLAESRGSRLHYGTTVEAIRTAGYGRNRSVLGLSVDGRNVDYDIVISNADVTPTYERLLRDTDARLYRRYQKLEPSSSGMVFYWGTRSSYPEFGVHNILFSNDYPGEFADLFEHGRMPTDPTVYINITSKVDPGDAPAGGENWFILVNAPADSGQDWEAERLRTRERVLARLRSVLGRDVESDIAVESHMLPPDIQRKTDSHRGSLYGISSNARLSAFLRHPNRSRRYRGLYFAGGSAHPGGGMPLATLSGKICADLIRRDAGQAPAPTTTVGGTTDRRD